MTAIFDIDGDGLVQTEVDGILIARYFLGRRGTELTSGVSLGGSPRATASELEGYLARIWPQVDVDADGEVTVADINLITRYMAGMSGSTLTSGVVSAGAIRKTSEDIEDYLSGMI